MPPIRPSVQPAAGEASALAWLFSFSDWERGVGWNKDAAPAEAWKLGRTRALLDLAGAPDRDLRIVHIAGTKGKGSTAAYLEAIGRAAGWRVGAYTQPHLHHYRERVRFNGRLISEPAFVRHVHVVRELVHRLERLHPEAGAPTTFELTTVLAILAFAEASVDLAIAEVGLGGRLDATNALDTDVAVVTPVGLDHRQILGRTLAEIAAEKAGIIRSGQVVFSARQRPPAMAAIRGRCAAIGADLHIVPPLPVPRSGPSRVADSVAGPLEHGRAMARGGATLGRHRHQRQNAALAVAVAEHLTERGLTLPAWAVERGLASAWLPARQEIVAAGPLVMVDAAHNADSARALADELRGWTVRPRWLVLGILRDKDAPSILRVLLPHADGVIVTAPMSPRALPASQLALACRSISDIPVETVPSVGQALALAVQRAGPDGGVVVTGSFATAAEAREVLGLGAVVTAEDRAAWIGRERS